MPLYNPVALPTQAITARKNIALNTLSVGQNNVLVPTGGRVRLTHLAARCTVQGADAGAATLTFALRIGNVGHNMAGPFPRGQLSPGNNFGFLSGNSSVGELGVSVGAGAAFEWGNITNVLDSAAGADAVRMDIGANIFTAGVISLDYTYEPLDSGATLG